VPCGRIASHGSKLYSTIKVSCSGQMGKLVSPMLFNRAASAKNCLVPGLLTINYVIGRLRNNENLNAKSGDERFCGLFADQMAVTFHTKDDMRIAQRRGTANGTKVLSTALGVGLVNDRLMRLLRAGLLASFTPRFFSDATCFARLVAASCVIFLVREPKEESKRVRRRV
jgi:hypothetical protein